MGKEVDLVPVAKYFKAASEAGDEHALVDYGCCLLYFLGRELRPKLENDFYNKLFSEEKKYV